MSQPSVYFAKFTFLVGKGFLLNGGRSDVGHTWTEKIKALKVSNFTYVPPHPHPESRQRYKGNKEMTGLIPALQAPNSSLSLTSAAAPGTETGPQTVPGKPKSQESQTVSNRKELPGLSSSHWGGHLKAITTPSDGESVANIFIREGNQPLIPFYPLANWNT